MLCAALAGNALSGNARAEVLSVASNGFEVRETVHVAASADKAYAALLLPARWWNSDHTFSGNAANLTLDARAGGCWCETLPDGGSGALGPFQGLGVDGSLTWSVKGNANGTEISVSYAAGGYYKDGFDALSKAADHVLGDQIERLRKFIDG